MAVGGKLVLHGFVCRRDVLSGAVDQMQQRAAALDMTEKTIAEADPLVRALDQAGNVSDNDLVVIDAGDTELRHQRGEGIVGDLGASPADRGEKCRFTRIRQPHQTDIGDQFEAQPDPMLLAGAAIVGTTRRLIDR